MTLARPGATAPILGSITRHANFRIGAHGMVLTWNAAATKVTGWRPDEIIGQDYAILQARDTLPQLPEPRAGAELVHRELLAAAEAGRYEQQCWLVRRNGTRIWSNLAISSMKDRQGRLRGFDAVVQDLTDRLLVDDLFAVLDATPEAILSIDERGVVTFANRAGRRLFGYLGEMRQIPVWQLLPALRQEELLIAPPGEAAAWPEPRLTVQGLELAALREDGTEFLAEISLSSVQSPRGRTVTVTVRPLPERVDSSLGTPDGLSVHRFGAVFDDSAVGRLEVSIDGMVLRANRALEWMLGYGPGGLTGNHWAGLVHPGDRAALDVDVRGLISGGGGYFEAERRLLRRDGRPVPGLLAATVLRDRSGRPVQLVAVVLDNSEPDRTRHQLLQLATQAARF